jgi:LmbE family N-acetylglucosaminyl deacetylase
MTEHRLLAVLAHPDDESFGMGGTLALYARQGVEVHLVCATRGEAGDVDPQLMGSFDTIAALRESELRCAAQHLGLSGVHFLDYRDSGMAGSSDNQHPLALAAQPVEAVAAKVATYLRRLQPQVVLTFDPIGGYHHPDHIAVHHATRRAFDLAGDPAFQDGAAPFRPSRLYFHVIPMRFLRFALRLLPLIGSDPHHFGRNGDIDLTAIVADSDFPVHARINYRPVRAQKEAASACHASQLSGGPGFGPLRWARYLLGSTDYYMRAIPPADHQPREKDLFAGI